MFIFSEWHQKKASSYPCSIFLHDITYIIVVYREIIYWKPYGIGLLTKIVSFDPKKYLARKRFEKIFFEFYTMQY